MEEEGKTPDDNALLNDKIIDMLDNADGQVAKITVEIEDQRKIAADASYPMEERLEAFEDIIDSEVGDTTMTRARNIEREAGFRQIFFKFEGGNPTGTQKDRIAFAQTMDALRRGYDTITMATCGNYGVAMALAASLTGLRCLIYIPDEFHAKRVVEMEKIGGEIIRVPGDYENAVVLSRERAEKDELYDANPGGANTPLQLRAYGEIAYEIYDDLRDAPAAIAVPVSNGTTLAGIYKGFLSLYRRGKTSRMPRIVAGSSYNKNPIVQAFLKNKATCEDLEPRKIHETKINEPLINWHSIDGDYALDAIRHTNGWAANATDKNLLLYSKTIREKEGLHVLPASTAGLLALLDQNQKHPLENDRYVVVLTGRKA
ncbi:MAG: pyridoxal-phosphate dependent enzyme [Deferribacteres bacterium]|nr:pyridoxal-phosphate dependent enzyme [candidate division KSB1 bacterium]MCB9503531.1 pyridoxal-phosphate dependent enzyme [Deferribacteres bacterium]